MKLEMASRRDLLWFFSLDVHLVVGGDGGSLQLCLSSFPWLKRRRSLSLSFIRSVPVAVGHPNPGLPSPLPFPHFTPDWHPFPPSYF